MEGYMLFTSKGQIYHEFLQFVGATLHYSVGYAVSFLSPDNHISPLHEYNSSIEPYEGYLVDHLKVSKKIGEMNKPYILYLSYSDALIYYPIQYHNDYLGTIFVGPMKLKDLASNQKVIRKDIISSKHKKEIEGYLNILPLVYQFQLQYLINLLNLILHSTYYNPTVVSTFSISSDNITIPPANKLSNKISHHKIDQEEKIVQRILLSKDSFKDLALKNISKLSNLVAPPLASHPIRSEKNRFVVAATIISRAAIRLGMSSESAFSYSDYFIKKVEECNTLDEVWELQMTLFSFYRKEVQKSRSGAYFNPITNMLLLYIENHIELAPSFQEICEQLDIDYKYASNCFKKDIGLGFNKYFTKKKMALAKRKLETTDLLIQDISEELGYNNAYYFTRTFKSMYGIAPAEYRKQCISET